MGLGDQVMATGMARGAAARGRRIAFGDKRRIRWDSSSEEVFRGNPNIAAPGSEGASDIEWVKYYKGNRIYNVINPTRERWVWNYDFKPVPGEFFFDAGEIIQGRRYGSGFVIIEPHVEEWKAVAPNKDWGRERYQAVCDRLRAAGLYVYQFSYPKSGPPLVGAVPIGTNSFRHASSILANAAIYVGAEGGLHHAAAALGIKAVVLFGGFVPPQVTGYDMHINLTGGLPACGWLKPCAHCRKAMNAITVEEVTDAALSQLRKAA